MERFFHLLFTAIKWAIFRTDCIPENIERNDYATNQDKKAFRGNRLWREIDAETDMPKRNNFFHLWQ